MNRLLATGIALITALGSAGLAQAQTNPNPAGTAAAPGIQAQTNPSAQDSSGMQTPSTAPTMPDTTATMPNNATTPSVGDDNAQAAANQGAPAATSQTTVREAQQALKSRGLYDGPIDGVFGQQTKTAISKFQQRNGLQQTAMLDRQTVERLIGSANTQSR